MPAAQLPLWPLNLAESGPRVPVSASMLRVHFSLSPQLPAHNMSHIKRSLGYHLVLWLKGMLSVACRGRLASEPMLAAAFLIPEIINQTT